MASVSDSASMARLEQARSETAEAERKRVSENHQKEIRKLNDSFADDREDSREEYNNRLLQQRKSAEDEVRKLKEEMYDNEGKRFLKDSRDYSDRMNQLESYQQDIDRDYSQRSEHLEKSYQKRAEEAENRKNDEIAKQLQAQKESHKLEMKGLQETIRQAALDPHDLDAERADARSKAIKEVEGPSLTERDHLMKSFENSIEKIKQDNEVERENSAKKMTEAKYETLGAANEMMRNQRKEFTKRDQQRVTELRQIEDQHQKDVAREHESAERETKILVANNEIQTKMAMRAQETALKQHYGNKAASDKYELAAQREQINKLQTTESELLASPALVEKIHRTEADRNAKAQQLEHEHLKNQADGLILRDSKDRKALFDDYQHDLTHANRQNARALDQQRSSLISGYEELRDSKERENAQLRDNQSSRTERTQVKHAQELDFQQRKNNESLQEQRETLSDQQRSQIDEIEFQNKVQARETRGKISEMRREYENKLADQAVAHEIQMNELRLEYDTKMRDQERKSQHDMDARTKGLEHLMKEQELAFKDKQRFLTEHYEEQIDKMKRTNARLIQKKS